MKILIRKIYIRKRPIPSYQSSHIEQASIPLKKLSTTNSRLWPHNNGTSIVTTNKTFCCKKKIFGRDVIIYHIYCEINNYFIFEKIALISFFLYFFKDLPTWLIQNWQRSKPWTLGCESSDLTTRHHGFSP